MSIITPGQAVSDDAVLHRYVFVNDGVPANGTFNGVAPVGALCINKDSALPGLYMNTGTKAATVWTAIHQEV